MIVYLNGSYLEAAEARVSAFDGGFLYGDGLFETMRLYSGRPFDLDGHLSRLRRELELLGYSWSVELGELRDILIELSSRNGLADQDSRARVTVSRGGIPGELLPREDLQNLTPTLFVTLAPLPRKLAVWQNEGVHVQVMKPAFARGNFPQLKTLNYLPSLMALRLIPTDCQEAILIDRQGKILEGATSNIFIVNGERLMTPPARLGLLAGCTRKLVLDVIRSLGYSCEEVAFDRRDLVTASEVFLTSSVREVTPVVHIDDSAVQEGRPGSITMAIQEKYRQDVRDALAEESSSS